MKRQMVLGRVFVCLVLCSLVWGVSSLAASMLQTDDATCPCPENATECLFWCPLAPCDHTESGGDSSVTLGGLLFGGTGTETAQLEAKLDGVTAVLDEFRIKLDSLGWWLGWLIQGTGIAIEPHSTNPIPQTNTWEQLARLEAKLDRLIEMPSDITIIDIYTLIVDINQWIINLGGNTAALEVKLDNLEAWLDDQFDWLDDYTDWLSDTLSANNAAIKANTTAISNLAVQVQALLTSNYRIEDMLRQQQGYPAAPGASKISLVMGGGPLPNIPWDATVAGTSGAVEPNAKVTVYWPIGLPPSIVTADGSGAFSLVETTGNVTYFAVEVTQTDAQGRESARTQILVSP